MERDKLLGTMDAKVWTDEFMATKDRLGDEEFDHAMMLAWFANAIMAGFDEANRRAQRALDALQAQLADRDAMILQMGEQAAVLAKENMAVKAQLQQVEEERDRAEGALIRAGFRKDCDIAACNCGPQWGHGGHASQRLREIADALPYQNGGVLLERIESLVRENATLRQLVAQLPVVDAQEVSVWLSPDESGWLVSKRPAFPAGLYWAKFRTQAEADSFRALLAYRATLVVQDAPQPAPNERVEYARLELAALFSTPGAPTLEQAKLVCENKNPADAQCILNAYEALREAAQDAGKEDVSHD